MGWWECIWRDFQWDLDLGILHGGSARVPRGDSCSKSLGCSASPEPPPKRGIKLGSHRERKGKEVVEPLGYTRGAAEGAPAGSCCLSRPAGLAAGPLEAGGTLLGIGRLAGSPGGGRGGGLDRPLGGRTSPHGGTIHSEGQA